MISLRAALERSLTKANQETAFELWSEGGGIQELMLLLFKNNVGGMTV